MSFFRVSSISFLTFVIALAAPAQKGSQAFDTARMNTSVSACEDFYLFANGNWLKTTEIPPAYSSWGSLDILAENNLRILHTILEETSKQTKIEAGSNDQKVGDFYATCMDDSKREAEGAKPLAPYFARIDQITDLNGVESELAYFHREGISALFSFGSGPDLKNSSISIGNASQGGLSLPNKDYYTKTDKDSVNLRAEFVHHASNLFQLLGDSPNLAAKNAQTVMSIESRLARASRGPVELRDPTTQYHMQDTGDLDHLTPHFLWGDYFGALGLPKKLRINMVHPEFFKAVDKLLAEVPIASWKTYLRWNLVNDTASALSANFETEDFNFSGRILEGRKEQYPRWRRCISATDDNLGEALGQSYVARTFTPEAKRRVQLIVEKLLSAFRDRLISANWMSDQTRKAALAKLAAFGQKIGYPDRWIDYTRLNISRDSYAANIIGASEFARWRDYNKIGKTVDKTEWDVTPSTANASYDETRNEIVFPAGILQPPFFNPEADDAINYGSIGAIIGHEITHGFDDEGAKFDLGGNLKDWWEAADKKNFEGRSNCIVKQFDAYEAAPGLHQNGRLVAGESIADLGGLTVSYYAFEKTLEGKPHPANIDGFTPEQRFFLGWAQVAAEKDTPELERLQAQADQHPLARFRVNGPLSNMREFAGTFQCKARDRMVRPREVRCQIW